MVLRTPLCFLLSVAAVLSTLKSQGAPLKPFGSLSGIVPEDRRILKRVRLPRSDHAQQGDRAWLQKVRIAAYGLTPKNAEQIVQQAQASAVYPDTPERAYLKAAQADFDSPDSPWATEGANQMRFTLPAVDRGAVAWID